MPTQIQLEADRRNSRNSTDFLSEKGEGPPRFDAMKSSIDAKAYVIPGEDAGELQAVIESYREKFLPDNALERFLVDGMIGADWESRRLREEKPDPGGGPGLPGGGDSEAPAPESGSFPPNDVASEAPAPELGSFLPKDAASEVPAPELGSFLPKNVAGEAPALELSSFSPSYVAGSRRGRSPGILPELGSFVPSDVAGEVPPITRLGSFLPAGVLFCRSMRDYSIGLDLGGTNLRAAAIDRSGAILEKISGSTPFSSGREPVLADMVSAISLLREKYGAAGLAGIGMGVPGFILFKEGIIRNSNNLPFLENFPIRQQIEQRLGTSVTLENDANAAALGEKWMGAGRGVEDLVLLTLGTGIGGGIITGGRVIRGYLGMGGELGHLIAVPGGNPCGCGSQGCLEKHASATAVTAMAQLMRLGEALTSKDVYDLALRDDETGLKAREIWRVVGENLGAILAMLVNTFNFPLYLLSGGMLPAWDLFAPPMIRTVEQRSATYRFSRTTTRIEPATLGSEAGLYGAAYLAWLEKPAGRPTAP